MPWVLLTTAPSDPNLLKPALLLLGISQLSLARWRPDSEYWTTSTIPPFPVLCSRFPPSASFSHPVSFIW